MGIFPKRRTVSTDTIEWEITIEIKPCIVCGTNLEGNKFNNHLSWVCDPECLNVVETNPLMYDEHIDKLLPLARPVHFTTSFNYEQDQFITKPIVGTITWPSTTITTNTFKITKSRVV